MNHRLNNQGSFRSFSLPPTERKIPRNRKETVMVEVAPSPALPQRGIPKTASLFPLFHWNNELSYVGRSGELFGLCSVRK
jgi:hypothetical protein